MGVDDLRDHLIFYGMYLTDWSENWGSFANHQYLLDFDYVSDGADTVDGSSVTLVEFLYPDHLKKHFAVEGTIKGHITFYASTVTSVLTQYRVTVCKMHEDLTPTELATTGWRTVSKTIVTEYEYVFPFWIDCWNEQHVYDTERLYVKVEFATVPGAASGISLMHSNDATWEDFKIDIPIRTK